MAGGSRKLHTKSRNSCGQCKKRRVKCDCIGPRCSNCRRRGEICDFSSLSPPPHRTPTTWISEQQQATVITFDLLPLPTSPDLDTLELLYHYEKETSCTSLLANDVLMLQVWQHDLPLAAQSHDFLLNGLLGLSALHKAHLCPSTQAKYHGLALKYQTKGSKEFRSVVDRISIDNSTAVFGFSLVSAIFQFKYCIGLDRALPKQDIDAIVDAVKALRGTFALATTHTTLFRNTCFGMIPSRAGSMRPLPVAESTSKALEALEAINISSESSWEEKVIYTDAIMCLRYWYSFVSVSPKTWDMVMRFPMTTSAEYNALLQRGHPMALVILTYWCVPVHRVSPRWFIEGWAESAVRIIASILPEAWKEALRWPIDEMEIHGIL